jgi:hypothetical protein
MLGATGGRRIVYFGKTPLQQTKFVDLQRQLRGQGTLLFKASGVGRGKSSFGIFFDQRRALCFQLSIERFFLKHAFFELLGLYGGESAEKKLA